MYNMVEGGGCVGGWGRSRASKEAGSNEGRGPEKCDDWAVGVEIERSILASLGLVGIGTAVGVCNGAIPFCGDCTCCWCKN